MFCSRCLCECVLLPRRRPLFDLPVGLASHLSGRVYFVRLHYASSLLDRRRDLAFSSAPVLTTGRDVSSATRPAGMCWLSNGGQVARRGRADGSCCFALLLCGALLVQRSIYTTRAMSSVPQQGTASQLAPVAPRAGRGIVTSAGAAASAYRGAVLASDKYRKRRSRDAGTCADGPP